MALSFGGNFAPTPTAPKPSPTTTLGQLVTAGSNAMMTPEGMAAQRASQTADDNAANDAKALGDQQAARDAEMQTAQIRTAKAQADAAERNAGTGSGSSRSSSSAGTGGNPQLDSLIAQVRNQQPTTITAPSYTPAQVPTGISPEADAATYGKAKENTGLMMQAAMRGLRTSMAQRGIVGTGIDAEEQGKVYSKGVGELGDVDRQLATDNAARQLAADQANAQSANQAGQFNASENLAAQQANQQAQNQRQQILLSLAGLY